MSTEIRVAVFSDVHGNVQGLEAVLAEIQTRGSFDRIMAAGDHCLKGPDPAAALDLVNDFATDVLVGNTDQDLVTFDPDNDLEIGGKKRDTIDWTRGQLGQERLNHLARLKFRASVIAPDDRQLLVVHANPYDTVHHIFPQMNEDELHELVGDVGADILVFGHLHIPYCRRFGELRLFNVAASGLPQDGDRRAVWGEFTWSSETGWTGCIHRVDYDFGETVLRIIDCDMPHPTRRIRDLVSARYA